MKAFAGWMLLLPLLAAKEPGANPSPEAFINLAFPIAIGETYSKYYIDENAQPCSFRKFDYDDWFKYGLIEPVPFYILNELAQSCSLNLSPGRWNAQKLPGAVSVDQKTASSLLSGWGHTRSKHIANLPPRMVFFFSKPAFAENGHYAVMDIGFRCDERQCGMGATYIFRLENGQWKVVGKRTVWES